MMRFFVVGTIAKDEPDIAEWAAYHLLIGAELVLIYDNGSRVPIRETLRGFIEAGLVEVFDIGGEKCLQHFVNSDLITKCREPEWASRWVGAIDADEYILPMQKEDMREVLAPYQPAGLVLSWALYGSSGHQGRPRKLNIDAYRMRERNLRQLHKTIFDPLRVTGNGDSHYYHYAPGEAPVNERGEPRYGAATHDPSGEIMRINHYFVKSVEDQHLKIERGAADWNAGKSWEAIQAHEAVANEMEDTGICRFIEGTISLLDRYMPREYMAWYGDKNLGEIRRDGS